MYVLVQVDEILANGGKFPQQAKAKKPKPQVSGGCLGEGEKLSNSLGGCGRQQTSVRQHMK